MTNKPKIYIRCKHHNALRNGTAINHHIHAETEKGESLTYHVCSSHAFGRFDMGIVGGKKHDVYRKKYPEGYELVDEL